MGRHKQDFLTEAQVEAIRLMVETDLTRQQIADAVGVNRSTLYTWMSNEKFKEKLIEYSDRILIDTRAESLRRIKMLMRQDEDKRTALQSAKFLAELNGLSATMKVDVKTQDTIKISIVDEDEVEE